MGGSLGENENGRLKEPSGGLLNPKAGLWSTGVVGAGTRTRIRSNMVGSKD